MKTVEVKAMGVYKLLQIMVKIFRFTEVLVAMGFLIWTFSRLPLVLRVSSDFISQISNYFTSPVFGFILCNIIIVSLIAKPHNFSCGKINSDKNVETVLFNELVEDGAVTSLSLAGSEPNGRLCSDTEQEEIAYEDKEVISEVTSTQTAVFSEKMEDFGLESEKLKLLWREYGGGELRRVKAEEEAIWGGGVSREGVGNGEELSNKEFERRIDAFIARELRFRWEESGAVVLRN
ncbi:uncharacterized protein LOC105436032 [Cucumis sativus]|uniref:DUF4408 domain-containing protein n=1 Tax=Cucumis sativus TaxID=3659 RepID=A0A0A0KM84_CUCSA|nr:uncharacterized protein LOC105436032 [Cucumis sativus]KGN48851.1 hypothetical protein Csa_002710 [Cucumis sativus]